MPRESKHARSDRAAAVIDRLHAHMPQARIELDYANPLELLVAVILSAQCTDKRVNLVTPALFARYPDVEALAAADLAELEGYIRTCGLYRSKAKNILAAAQALRDQHGARVPSSRALLEQLPGVGHKTAGVVCAHLGGDLRLPGGHAHQAAGVAARLHHPDASGQGGGGAAGAAPRRALDGGPPAPHLARAADVLRPLARVRAMRGGGPLPPARREGPGAGQALKVGNVPVRPGRYGEALSLSRSAFMRFIRLRMSSRLSTERWSTNMVPER